MKYFKKIMAIGLSISILSSLSSCAFLQGQNQGHIHQADTEWYSNSKAHWHKCTGEDCTLVTDRAEHTFNDGVVTKQPTDTENGYMTYTCSVCGYEKNTSLNKLGHVHEYDSNGICFCQYARDQFSKHVYTSNGYSLNYQAYVPSELSLTEKAPLILFLHGAGERGSDNQAQLKNAIMKVAGKGEWAKAVIIAPQCPSSTGGNTNSDVNDPNKWAETNWQKGNYLQDNLPESKPLHAAAELIKEYASYDYIDADRVYVVGLSMGGFGTWDIISRYPELFAAAVPICGGGPKDRIDILKNIPIYTFHGTADTAVPYAGTQEMYNSIVAAGGDKILFHTFQGAGHGIWDQAITFKGSGALPSLESWLFSQNTKNNEPVKLPHTSVFDVSEEDEVFSKIVDNNGYDGFNRLTSKKHTTGVFYELTQGASFTVDVTASEDAEATFIIKLLGSGSFAYKDLVKSISVTSGGLTTEATINDGQAELIGWHVNQGQAVSVEFATVSLKKGENTITFTMGNNNVNISGVSFASFAEITHEAVRTEYGNSIQNYDPFISDNGGSITTNGSSTVKADNSNGVFYMNNQKSTFTFTVNADKATDAVLCLTVVFNNANGYATNSIITSITSLDASGQENNVEIADAVIIKNNSWNYTLAVRADFAIISLKEGVNTITFTFGSNDVNISGVYLKSDSEVIFGSKK